MSPEQAQQLVIDVLSCWLTPLGLSASELAGETDLIAAKIVDSVGFLDLVLELETRADVELDLSDLDPAEFVTVNGLVTQLVAARQASVAARESGTARQQDPVPLPRAKGAATQASAEPLSFVPAAEITASELLACTEWVVSASRPFVDVLFGSASVARDNVARWLLRPESEYAIHRAELLVRGTEVLGGYLALSGRQLVKCRRADYFELLKLHRSDPALRQRLQALGGLFGPVPDGCLYVSKVGVRAQAQGRGLGWRLLRRCVHQGKKNGFRRFQMDVSEDNEASYRLGQALGFVTIHRGRAPAYGLAYRSMALEYHGARPG